MYAPVVRDINLEYTYDEARQLIISSLSPLGNDYQDIIRRAFNERWIDGYPTAGVDMTTIDPFDIAIASMNGIMDEMDEILDRLGK